jgi:gas vesicle protein
MKRRKRKMAQEKGSKNFIIGFLAGSAIGAVAALLMATKPGKELRDELMKKKEDILDEADGYLSDAKGKAKDIINAGKERSDKLINEAKVKSEELLKDAEKMFSEAKTKASTIINEGKETFNNESGKIKNAFKSGMDAFKDVNNS